MRARILVTILTPWDVFPHSFLIKPLNPNPLRPALRSSSGAPDGAGGASWWLEPRRRRDFDLGLTSELMVEGLGVFLPAT